MMVTYNRLNLTKRTFESLFRNVGHPVIMIVVDNGSTDGTVEWIKSQPWYEAAVCQFNSQNKGIAVGRNQALKLADAQQVEWYATVDNDVEMPPGWLVECMDIIKANPKMGMVGVNMEDKPYPLVTMNGKTFQLKAQGNLGTACAVFTKKLHRLIGFFNTEYGPYGEEDADFGMRSRVVGYQLGYIERAGIHFGVNENDTGEYRKYKTECHQKNLDKFRKNCSDYYNHKKSYYIPYREL